MWWVLSLSSFYGEGIVSVNNSPKVTEVLSDDAGP